MVRDWRLSTFSALPNGKDPLYNEMPDASEDWKTISTERKGLGHQPRISAGPCPNQNGP